MWKSKRKVHIYMTNGNSRALGTEYFKYIKGPTFYKLGLSVKFTEMRKVHPYFLILLVEFSENA